MQEQIIGFNFKTPQELENEIVRIYGGCDSIQTYKHISDDNYIVYIDNCSYLVSAEISYDEDISYTVTECYSLS